MTRLWKTTIVIWSKYDPQEVELEDLAREATSGAAYCSRQKALYVMRAEDDSDWDGTEFFQEPDND